MIRVWFNHWFSTSYRLIELMKADLDTQVYVIGSNRQINSVIQKVCDEWYEDSDLDKDAYLQYCLDFCIEHKIDVFVPRHNMLEISRHKSKFEEIGVKVMVDAFPIIELLEDKASTYKFFQEEKNINVPEYYIVNNAAQFETAYQKLKSNCQNTLSNTNYNNQICIKFVHDEGGMSFRKIVENADRFKRLRVYQGADITYSELVEILKAGGEFDDMMVMPYLSGDEISVDCLDTNEGLIAIPRRKSSSRHETVIYDEEILSMTKIIIDKTKLQFPCNIQYRLMNNIPYLLEINPRMSGGLQMSCLAADINIPNIALNKLLGKAIPWKMDKSQKIVSYIEMPQIIK